MFKKKDFIYISLLLLISIILFFVNYKPGTFLVGWDVVMPELNFKANFWRNIMSVWQSYRGLGVEDGMAYAANLIHTIFMYLLSFILPLNILRYFFHIFVHFLGGLGMYFLLKRFNKKPILAFFGALFYMFNLATIQMFFAPLEVFSIHFAALPWLVMTTLNIFQQRNKKNIILFFVVNLLATPQGFVPTIFIAYLVVILSISAVEILKYGKNKNKEILLVLGIIFAVNSFWLMPFVHSAVTQGPIIKNAKINQISSDEIYEKNKKRGNLLDILYLKGFMVDITENNLKGDLVYIMKPWNDWENKPIIYGIASIFVIFLGVGFLNLIKNYKEKAQIKEEFYFIPLFLISILMLGTNTPILSQINAILRNVLPLFGEAFRFPFTKFFIVYAFAYTIIMISGLEYLLNKVNHKQVVTLIFAFFILIYAFPAFNGNFFYDVERLKIPEDYFDTVNYFKQENVKARIMTLPQTTFWNWGRDNWGYRGSGFLWYGVEQPMLERPFDPWSNYNEQYFNELFYALQTQNKNLFQNVINKYDISFILIDGNIANSNKIQRKDKTIQFVSNIYPSAEIINYGEVAIFKLENRNNQMIKNNVKPIGSTFKSENIDQAYLENGDYFQSENWQTSYLFPSLFSNKTQADLEYSISIKEDVIAISPKNITKNISGILEMSSFSKSEFYVPSIVQVNGDKLLIRPIELNLILDQNKYQIQIFKPISFTLVNSPSIKINGKEIDLSRKNNVLLYSNLENVISINNELTNNIIFNLEFPENTIDIPSNLNKNNQFKIDIEKFPLSASNLLAEKTYTIQSPCQEDIRDGLSLANEDNGKIKLVSLFNAGCFNLFLDNLPQQAGVLVNIKSIQFGGEDLKIYIDNPEQKSVIIETKLNGINQEKNIIIPPTSSYLYSNYGLHIRNESAGVTISSNTIESINVDYMPYNWLKTLKITNNNFNEQSIYYLSEAYNPGWLAFSNGKILPHVKVNNWANGWLLDNESNNIQVIFWPQYLEFLGFGLLVLTLIFILLYRPKIKVD